MIVVTEPTAEVITTANQTSYSLGAFTPAASSLIVVAAFMNDVSQGMTCTDSAGLTWSVGASVQSTDFGGRWFYALAPLAPASTTITVTRASTDAATPSGAYVQSLQFLGVDTAAVVRQAKSGTTSSSDISITFSDALLPANAYFAAIFNVGTAGANAFFPPASWTEVADGSFSAPARAGGGGYRSQGESGTSVTYQYNQPVAGLWLAAEIKAAPDRGHQVIWML